MATMYPVLDAAALAGLSSRAEAKFYVACRDQLPLTTLVVHSLALIRLAADGSRRDAEADFVVVDPDRGILIVEVKGGAISFGPITGEWSSTNASGKHRIKDPFRQALEQKHAIRSYLNEDPKAVQLKLGRIAFAHAVAFPDVDNLARVRLPAAPREIVGGADTLDQLERWIANVFGYWAGQGPGRDVPGAAGVAACKRILCSPVSARPVMARQLADEEAKRIELTRQQARLLRALGMRRRAVICGGAGTGKTVLALERALEMARSGRRVLLLCYNRPLSDHLKAAADGVENLHTMTFHQLCAWRARVAHAETGSDPMAQAALDYPTADRFEVQFPFALALAIEATSLRYNAILVDEAQDFSADYWLPLEMLLADPNDGLLYAFLDHNQAVYGRAARPPINDDPFLLTANCRNTRSIHAAAYRHYSGTETDHPDIEGAPLEEVRASTPEAQALKIGDIVTRLLVDERVAPSDMAVLVVSDAKRHLYDAIARQPLPRGVSWGLEVHRTPGIVTVDTVSRFKGLEAAVVLLCGFESANPESQRELLYVGLSRGKSRVFLLGSTEALKRNFSSR
jgi:hypothetical protein